MTDEQLLLATAYVDDELSPDERARAENDPEVWAEVQRQQSIQQLAQSIPPYSHDVAQNQISRAVAEAIGGSDGVAPVITLASKRRRTYRLVSGSIAAGLLLLVLGVGTFGILSSLDGSGEAGTSAGEDASSDTEAELGYDRTDDSASDMPAPAAEPSEDVSDSYAESTVVDAVAATTAPAATAPADGGVAGAASLVFSNEDELIEIGRLVLAGLESGVFEPASDGCDVTTESGLAVPVVANAISNVDAPSRPVVLAIDIPTTGDGFVIYAADPVDCDVLMSAAGSFDR